MGGLTDSWSQAAILHKSKLRCDMFPFLMHVDSTNAENSHESNLDEN